MRETLQSQQNVALAICLTLALLLSSPLHAQTTTIGSVSDIDDHGRWFVYPDAESKAARKLGPWQDVPAGGVIRLQSPQAGDHLAIIDNNLKPLVNKTCGSASDCNGPIYLPRTLPEPPSALTAFYRKVLDRLSAEPYEPSMHRTRSAGVRMDEAVVPITGGKLDLQPVMQHMPKGSYSLAPVGPHPAAASAKFSWNSAKTPIVFANRKPGLYEISLLQAANAESSLAASVRILACASQDCARLADSFQQAKALTQGWPNPSSPETHAFLRAYLAELMAGKP